MPYICRATDKSFTVLDEESFDDEASIEQWKRDTKKKHEEVVFQCWEVDAEGNRVDEDPGI